mgnify:CR=1 FL=1
MIKFICDLCEENIEKEDFAQVYILSQDKTLQLHKTCQAKHFTPLFIEQDEKIEMMIKNYKSTKKMFSQTFEERE